MVHKEPAHTSGVRVTRKVVQKFQEKKEIIKERQQVMVQLAPL